MAPQMKGLTLFIADIRNSKDMDEERKRITLEINNIRTKFAGLVNGYNRRKYVCKLVYMFLLGYSEEVDFGVKELGDLVNLNVFLVKLLGYLAMLVLLGFRRGRVSDYLVETIEQMHPALIRDLKLELEAVNCLAINYIALAFAVNDGTRILGGDETAPLWQELVDVVYLYCTLPMASLVVKLKAVLALNTLLKVFFEVQDTWVPRLLTLVDLLDLNLVTLALPVIERMLLRQPQFLRLVLPSIALRLYQLVVEHKCPPAFLYYSTPAPWLVIKLLQLLEAFFLAQRNDGNRVLLIVDFDEPVLSQLRAIVAQLIQNANQPARGLPNRNSQTAILFQTVLLAMFLDASPDAIEGAVAALLGLCEHGDTNTKYLALDALVKLTARLTQLEPRKFDPHHAMLYKLLYDKDVLVRRKALDLICSVCHRDSYPQVIAKLLEYFPVGDFSLKQELAVKIAVLAEQFATDLTWYVTTMLRLLQAGGGYNANGASFILHEIWERIVQIVVNNPDLQAKTCRFIVLLLRQTPEHGKSSPGTPENLVKVASVILGEFCQLLSDLAETLAAAQFKLLYNVYFKVSLATRAMLLSTFIKFVAKFPEADFIPDIVDLLEVETMLLDLEIQTRAHEYLRLATTSPEVALAILLPLPAFIQRESPLNTRMGLAAKPTTQSTSTPALTLGWAAGYNRMLHYDAGIFYENQLVKIIYRMVKDHHQIVYKFTVINNAGKLANTIITGFTVLTLQLGARDASNPLYVALVTELPQSTITSKTSMEVSVNIRHCIENDELPRILFAFTCGGSFTQLNLRFPVVLLRLLLSQGMQHITEADFATRWAQIGSQLGDGEFRTAAIASHRHNLANMVRLLTRLGFAVVHASIEDEGPIDVRGAGILNTQVANYGLLCHLASKDELGKAFEVIVRCTGGGVAEIIAQSICDIIKAQ